MKSLPVYLRFYQGALAILFVSVLFFFYKLATEVLDTSSFDNNDWFFLFTFLFIVTFFIAKIIFGFKLVQLLIKIERFKSWLQILMIIFYIIHLVLCFILSFLLIETCLKSSFETFIASLKRLFYFFIGNFASIYILIVDVILFQKVKKNYKIFYQQQINSINQ